MHFSEEKEEQKFNKDKIALPISFPFSSIFTNIAFGIFRMTLYPGRPDQQQQLMFIKLPYMKNIKQGFSPS